ncbi:hypothetical protein ILYODFUR_024882 [Ilyodon furcidens]|uniref:Uncharacterized protein n=1 Tax=Ilyodon furcidens TaxID=33524 RepID=A0ABV0V5X0_9TELE
MSVIWAANDCACVCLREIQSCYITTNCPAFSTLHPLLSHGASWHGARLHAYTSRKSLHMSKKDLQDKTVVTYFVTIHLAENCLCRTPASFINEKSYETLMKKLLTYLVKHHVQLHL